jgi:hypothetical protein
MCGRPAGLRCRIMRYTDPREVDEDETVMTGRQEAEMGMQQWATAAPHAFSGTEGRRAAAAPNGIRRRAPP